MYRAHGLSRFLNYRQIPKPGFFLVRAFVAFMTCGAPRFGRRVSRKTLVRVTWQAQRLAYKTLTSVVALFVLTNLLPPSAAPPGGERPLAGGSLSSLLAWPPRCGLVFVGEMGLGAREVMLPPQIVADATLTTACSATGT